MTDNTGPRESSSGEKRRDIDDGKEVNEMMMMECICACLEAKEPKKTERPQLSTLLARAIAIHSLTLSIPAYIFLQTRKTERKKL